MQNCSPLKRKSSSLEKKLQIYEFEVDENEPKVKQKKKRGPKPATKNKLPYGVNKKGNNTKYNFKNLNKANIAAKNLISTAKTENLNSILSEKNDLPKREVRNKRKEAVNSRKPQKENIVPSSDKREPLKGILSKKNNFTQVDNKLNSPAIATKKNISSVEKENVRPPSDACQRILSTKNSASPLFENRIIPKAADEKNAIKSCKENKRRNTIEVPVLFHNEQDATPIQKNISTEKPAFSAMSDDEDQINDNHSINHCYTSPAIVRPDTKQEVTCRTSFYHDNSYDHHINASTPVKYHGNDSSSIASIDNCFGFDEPELFEEPLVSPIKLGNTSGSSHSTAYSTQSVHKKVIPDEGKEEIPVNQVIRMLKYGIDDDEKSSTEIKSSSSNSSSPIFLEEPVKISDKRQDVTTRVKKPVPRRSYDRPLFLRKKNKSFDQESGDETSDEEKLILPKVKEKPKKKIQGPSKKEKDEMQKWIKAFNSQCQEIEKFDLLVE